MKIDGKMHFVKSWKFAHVSEVWWVCLRWDEDAENWRVGGLGHTWQSAYNNYRHRLRRI